MGHKGRQAVLPFDGGTEMTRSSAVRGGKGSSLALMVDLGLPVPPGFTFHTGVSRAFMQHGRLPTRAHEQLEREISRLERLTGRKFGDPNNPLLISVRSGAQQSMPGMMDTILNVGIDPDNVGGLVSLGGECFANDTKERFLSQWKRMFHGCKPPTNSDLQLMDAIHAVLRSWNSDRAQAYRKAHGIPDYHGTAVTVQAMVFGNLDQQSCTGVVFSADVATGKKGLFGEFLTKAQGEDVVSGIFTPRPIADMQVWNPNLYAQLERHVRTLEAHYSSVVDVEFTVEKGVLYILQCRKAKRSPQAQITWAVHDVWAKRITKQEALDRVSESEVQVLRRPTFSEQAVQGARLLARGLAASPGAASGVVALTSEEAKQFAAKGWSVVLVREDTSPDDLSGMLVAKAIVTARGGATSHAAVVARELGLPAVTGGGFHATLFYSGMQVSVDGSRGVVLESRLPLEKVPSTKEVNIFFKWWDEANSYTPRIGFEWYGEILSANVHLNDFYLTEMMVQQCAGTPLEKRARQLRSKIHRRVAESFALYLLVAAAGESRHYYRVQFCREPEADKAMSYACNLVKTRDYKNTSDDRDRMHNEVARVFRDLSLQTQIRYVESIYTAFHRGSWDPSYGGDSWAAIAKALLDFLKGDLSLTLFVDHVFDLEHNGGRLFNKNSMFSELTVEAARGDQGTLEQQLDIKKTVTQPNDLFHKLYKLAPPSREVVKLWEVVRKMVM